MKVYYNYLADATFLKKLAKEYVKTYYVKIAVLNWEEEPVESIEGKVISANLNVDGQSSLRRTANLSILLDDSMSKITSTENILSINKKMFLEIGYVNTTREYTDYPILWFPLGTYIIISCSISESESGLVASLQLQDKMCLLNGTVGGTIPAAADLHVLDTIDEDGNSTVEYVTIYQIIQELVNHWGGEQLGKIIISDLDNKVKQVMKWGLSSPLFLLREEQQNFYYSNESDLNKEIEEAKKKEKKYSVTTFQKGQDVGYIYTDFIYPGELIADAGSSVTDMLDKIIQVLGNFEYFYDLDGNFIFQEKKNFLNNAQSKYILDAKNNVKKDSNGKVMKDTDENPIPDPKLVPDYVAAISNPLSSYLINMTGGSSVFEFEDSTLITSYSNTPQYGTIKNDFVIWGIRTDSEGNQIPLRYHLAIDNKPLIENTPYFMFNYKEYELDQYGIWKMLVIIPKKEDSKYSNYGNLKIDKLPTASANILGIYYYDQSKTSIKTVVKKDGEWTFKTTSFKGVTIKPKDWRTQLLIQGAAAQIQGLATNYYYAQLKNEWPRIYDVKNGKYYKEVLQDPSSINYYLDFISLGDPKIFELSVDNIGRRSYISNGGKNINCVFETQIPDIIFIKTGQTDTEEKKNEAENRGWKYSLVSEIVYDNLKIGGTHYSAYQEIRQTLHEFTNYNESITLQTLPLYFLEPNTRISVNNPASNMSGDYVINSLSFSLDNAGLLTINATKAVERI